MQYHANLMTLKDWKETLETASSAGQSDLLNVLALLEDALYAFSEQDRNQLVSAAIGVLSGWTVQELAQRMPRSLIGTAAAYAELLSNAPLHDRDFTDLADFSLLATDLDNEVLIDYCTSRGKLTLAASNPSLDERNAQRVYHSILRLLDAGLIAVSRSLLTCIANVLVHSPPLRKIHSIFSALDKNDETAFATACSSMDIFVGQSVEQKYASALSQLPLSWVPTSFVRKGNDFFNNNLFPTLCRNDRGDIQLVFPFTTVQVAGVREIYRYDRAQWVPAITPGPWDFRTIFAFSKAANHTPSEAALRKIATFTEDDLSDRFNKVLIETNKHEHSPTEVADVMTRIKLFSDARPVETGFVLKAKGTPKVNPREIDHQVLHALQAQPTILFIVYTTRLLHEVQKDVPDLCGKFNTPYCILGTYELAAIFEAYGVL